MGPVATEADGLPGKVRVGRARLRVLDCWRQVEIQSRRREDKPATEIKKMLLQMWIENQNVGILVGAKWQRVQT